MEEFAHKEIYHIAGEMNCAADGLSRLDMEDRDYDSIQFEQPK